MPRRKIIQIDENLCTGCGQCVIDCAEGALEIVDGKAKVIKDLFCDGLGACIGGCPEGALTIIEREADAFDEAAVEAHLAKREGKQADRANEPPPMACGCPGSMLRVFEQAEIAPEPQGAPQRSMLAQWPVQLRLLPTDGPLYAGKDLMLIADCVAVALPDLHRKLVAGNTVVLSCPKLDDARESIDKLTEIFKNPINSITCAIMEVPCCGGLLRITEEAAKRAGRNEDFRTIQIGIKGDILREETRTLT